MCSAMIRSAAVPAPYSLWHFPRIPAANRLLLVCKGIVRNRAIIYRGVVGRYDMACRVGLV